LDSEFGNIPGIHCFCTSDIDLPVSAIRGRDVDEALVLNPRHDSVALDWARAPLHVLAWRNGDGAPITGNSPIPPRGWRLATMAAA